MKEWLKAHPHLSCVIPKYGTVCFLKYDYKIDSNTFCEKLQEETGVFLYRDVVLMWKITYVLD
ncbi:MAG: hypothetical protein V8R62_03080, partial [Faecalibacillus intestinalis]